VRLSSSGNEKQINHTGKPPAPGKKSRPIIAQSAFLTLHQFDTITFQGNAPELTAYGDWFESDPATIYYNYGTTGWGPLYGGRPTVMLGAPAPHVGSAGIQFNNSISLSPASRINSSSSKPARISPPRSGLHWPPIPSLCPPQIAPGSAGMKSGGFGFTLTSLTNQTIVVEASTNLVNWQPIWTNTQSGASANFVDSEWLNHSNRFYRARSD